MLDAHFRHSFGKHTQGRDCILCDTGVMCVCVCNLIPADNNKHQPREMRLCLPEGGGTVISVGWLWVIDRLMVTAKFDQVNICSSKSVDYQSRNTKWVL